MILMRAGLIHIFKVISSCMLALGIFFCLLLTYAYISGDQVDRDDMHRTAGQLANYIRVIPHADAAPAPDRD